MSASANASSIFTPSQAADSSRWITVAFTTPKLRNKFRPRSRRCQFLRRQRFALPFQSTTNTRSNTNMPSYVCLIQFKDQGIRNIQDTVKRGDAAIAEAEKIGMKIVEEFWTMGAYDAVVVVEAPDDETVSAFMLKVSSLGNVKGQTLRAFRRNEMEAILAKIK